MAQKRSKEQRISSLNDSIARTRTKITNARNAIGNQQANKDALQELHCRLETELEALEDQGARQSDNYEGLEGWRGDIYTGYQYQTAELSAGSENARSIVQERLDKIWDEIRRLEDAVYENQLDITRWTSAVTGYERELFWAKM